jgi:hypothetical protein
MDTMEQRLQVLEREFQRSRRVHRILILAVVAIACIAGAEDNTPDASKPTTPKQAPSSDDSPANVGRPLGRDCLRTVEASQFVLLDRLGRSRARMLVTDDGPAISMFDEDGQKRLELSHTRIASGLRLFDSNESPVVSLQLPHNVDPAHLEIRSPGGRSLTKADGFSVHDAANHGRLHLALVNGNFPVLGIRQSGQNGPPSIEMTASEGSRSLKLHDDDGFPMFSLFAADDGRTSLDMRHPDHERSLQICTGPKDLDGPVIAFFAPAKEDGTGGLLPHLQLGFDNDRQPYIRVVDSDGRTSFAAPPQ